LDAQELALARTRGITVDAAEPAPDATGRTMRAGRGRVVLGAPVHDLFAALAAQHREREPGRKAPGWEP